MATLHLERGDTHQAIIFYEKLLHLGVELRLQSGSGKGEAGEVEHQDTSGGRTKSDAVDSDRPMDGAKEAGMPDYWTKELQCGLHLNLSIAYKTIGNMAVAARHAEKWVLVSFDGSTAAK